MTRPVGLGLIGLGTIGRLHARILTDSTQHDFTLVAAADVDPRAADRVSVPVFRDHRPLLDRPDVTAVSIATPPSTHYRLALDALSGRRDVLLEKPPTLTVTESQHLIEFAARHERVLFMAFHARYHATVEHVRAELDGQTVIGIQATFKEDVLKYHEPGSWVFTPEVAGGGALMDSGINAVSILTRILPKHQQLRVVAAQLSHPPGFQVETSAHVAFAFGDHGLGSIDVEWRHQGTEVRTVAFRTEDCTYEIDVNRDRLLKNGVVVDVGPTAHEYALVYQEFARHLARRASSWSTRELQFVKDAYRSAGREY